MKSPLLERILASKVRRPLVGVGVGLGVGLGEGVEVVVRVAIGIGRILA